LQRKIQIIILERKDSTPSLETAIEAEKRGANRLALLPSKENSFIRETEIRLILKSRVEQIPQAEGSEPEPS